MFTNTPVEIGSWSLSRATLGYKGNLDRTDDILDWLFQRLAIKSDSEYSEAESLVMQRKLYRLSGRGLEELLLCIGIWMQDSVLIPSLKKSVEPRALTAESICKAIIRALQDDLSVLVVLWAVITNTFLSLFWHSGSLKGTGPKGKKSKGSGKNTEGGSKKRKTMEDDDEGSDGPAKRQKKPPAEKKEPAGKGRSRGGKAARGGRARKS